MLGNTAMCNDRRACQMQCLLLAHLVPACRCQFAAAQTEAPCLLKHLLQRPASQLSIEAKHCFVFDE